MVDIAARETLFIALIGLTRLVDILPSIFLIFNNIYKF